MHNYNSAFTSPIIFMLSLTPNIKIILEKHSRERNLNKCKFAICKFAFRLLMLLNTFFLR